MKSRDHHLSVEVLMQLWTVFGSLLLLLSFLLFLTLSFSANITTVFNRFSPNLGQGGGSNRGKERRRVIGGREASLNGQQRLAVDADGNGNMREKRH